MIQDLSIAMKAARAQHGSRYALYLLLAKFAAPVVMLCGAITLAFAYLSPWTVSAYYEEALAFIKFAAAVGIYFSLEHLYWKYKLRHQKKIRNAIQPPVLTVAAVVVLAFVVAVISVGMTKPAHKGIIKLLLALPRQVAGSTWVI